MAKRAGSADLVCIAREALFNPHWGLHAALALRGDDAYGQWPQQYGPWLARRAKILDETAAPLGTEHG